MNLYGASTYYLNNNNKFGIKAMGTNIYASVKLIETKTNLPETHRIAFPVSLILPLK